MRVIVVGAGVAGLTAADAARCAGAEVVVVEARDRVGGRTWTAPLGAGAVDLGAAWIHGPVGNPLAEAVRAAGLETRNDGSYCARMSLWDGGWAAAEDATTVAAVLEGDWDPAEALAAVTGSDRLSDGVEWYLADRELDGRAGELAQYAIEAIVAAIVIAAPPDRISLAGAAAYSEGSGGNLVLTGGYASLVERLADGIDVRLSQPATRIRHAGGGVAVETAAGAVEGDRAVVAVPLGVLRAEPPCFDPPLGADHATAAGRLEMGTAEKLVLGFGERFWPRSVHHITHVADDGSFPFWDDISARVGSPTLVAFHNPTATPRLEGLAPADRVQAGLEALRRMFGRVPEPEHALVTDWARDPWARGSYSYVPLGASAEDMRTLAEPVSERLVLAGEATVPHAYGTVHGAFASGLRAAGQVLGSRPERISLGPVPERWLA